MEKKIHWTHFSMTKNWNICPEKEVLGPNSVGLSTHSFFQHSLQVSILEIIGMYIHVKSKMYIKHVNLRRLRLSAEALWGILWNEPMHTNAISILSCQAPSPIVHSWHHHHQPVRVWRSEVSIIPKGRSRVGFFSISHPTWLCASFQNVKRLRIRALAMRLRTRLSNLANYRGKLLRKDSNTGKSSWKSRILHFWELRLFLKLKIMHSKKEQSHHWSQRPPGFSSVSSWPWISKSSQKSQKKYKYAHLHLVTTSTKAFSFKVTRKPCSHWGLQSCCRNC